MVGISGKSATIEILLATYNGEEFLAVQLDSLLAQSDDDWRLLIRDDGSSDGTPAIIRRYLKRHPRRIRLLLGDPESHVGPRTAFSRLLESSSAPYLMFCDQDDLWLPDKIARTRAQMEELEATHGSGRPLLVFSDTSLVGEGLRPIAASGWDYLNTRPPIPPGLSRLLLINPASGCTMMINRALADLARPIPPEAVMHDHWLLLVAAACGHYAWLAEATVLYRRHARCATATEGWSPAAIMGRLGNLAEIRRLIERVRLQAEVLQGRYHPRLSAEDRRLLAAYLSLPELGRWRRLLTICRHGLHYPGWLRNLGWLVLGR